MSGRVTLDTILRITDVDTTKLRDVGNIFKDLASNKAVFNDTNRQILQLIDQFKSLQTQAKAVGLDLSGLGKGIENSFQAIGVNLQKVGIQRTFETLSKALVQGRIDGEKFNKIFDRLLDKSIKIKVDYSLITRDKLTKQLKEAGFDENFLAEKLKLLPKSGFIKQTDAAKIVSELRNALKDEARKQLPNVFTDAINDGLNKGKELVEKARKDGAKSSQISSITNTVARNQPVTNDPNIIAIEQRGLLDQKLDADEKTRKEKIQREKDASFAELRRQKQEDEARIRAAASLDQARNSKSTKLTKEDISNADQVGALIRPDEEAAKRYKIGIKEKKDAARELGKQIQAQADAQNKATALTTQNELLLRNVEKERIEVLARLNAEKAKAITLDAEAHKAGLNNVNLANQYDNHISRVNSVSAKQIVDRSQEILANRLQGLDPNDIPKGGLNKLRSQSLRQATTESFGFQTGAVNSSVIKGNKSLSDTVGKLKEVDSAVNKAESSVNDFGLAIGLALRRFIAFQVGSQILFAITGTIKSGIDEALKFEAALTKIEQAVDGTKEGMRGLSDIIRDVAKAGGALGSDVAAGIQIFSQAGFKNLDQLKGLATDLVKIPLAGTFDNISATAEGLLSVLGQFKLQVKDVPQILDLVNNYAKDFAIESKDLFEGVSRAGAGFAIAGGSIEEFIQLMSVLREGTRQSAEVIGTFFKTGFSQLFRPKSQSLIKSLGVDIDQSVVGELKDLADAIYGVNSALNSAQKLDITRQLLPDARQVGLFSALLRELADPAKFDRLQKASSTAFGSLDKSVKTRADDIGQSLNRIKASLSDVVNSLVENTVFKSFISNIADLVQALNPLLGLFAKLSPLILAVATNLYGGKIRDGLKNTFDVLKNGVGSTQGKIFADNLRTRFSAEETENILRKRANNEELPAEHLPFIIGSEKNAKAQALVQRRQQRIQLGTGLAFTGAALAGGLLSSSEDLSTASAGKALNIGGSVGVLIGAINPLAGIFAAIGAAGLSLVQDLNKAQKELVDKLIGDKAKKGLRQDLTTQDFSELGNAVLSNFQGKNQIGLNANTVGSALGGISPSFIGTGPLLARTISDTILSKTLGDPNFASNQNKELNQKLLSEVDAKTPEGNKVAAYVNQAIQSTRKSVLRDTTSRDADALQLEIKQKAAATINKSTPEIDKATARLLVDKIFTPGGESAKARENSEKGIIASATIASSALNKFAKNVEDQALNLNRSMDAYNQVIIDLRTTGKINLPTNDSDIADTANFAKARRSRNEGFAFTLEQNSGIKKRLENFKSDAENSVIDGRTFFKTFGNNDKGQSTLDPKTIEDLGNVFDHLAIETRKTVEALVDDFVHFDGSITDFVDQNTLGAKAVGDFVKSVRNETAILNKELEIRQSLSGQLVNISAALGQVKTQIQENGRSIDIANLATDLFQSVVNGTDNVFETLKKQSQLASKQATTNNFDTTLDTFIQHFTDVNQALVKASDDFSKTQDGSLNQSAQKAAAINQIAAKEAEAKASNEFALRLNDLQNRLGKASEATTKLREVFSTLQGDLRKSGSTVAGKTERQFTQENDALKKFLDNSKGGKDVTAGLNSLTSKEAEKIKGALDFLGNAPLLPGGNSGVGLSNKVDETLGAAGQASALARLGIGNFDTNLAKILESQKQAAEAAAKAAEQEQKVRDDFGRLVESSQSNLDVQKDFYNQQIKMVETLSKTFADSGFGADVNSIKNNMQKLTDYFSGKLDGRDMAGGLNPKTELTVTPIQVNVSLTAPDIVKLAGAQLADAVIAKVGPAISQAFGVISPEAQSKFDSGLTSST